MLRNIFKIIALFAFTLYLVPFQVSAQEINPASEIIRKAEDAMRGTSQVGSYTMKIIREDWTREMSMDFWAEGTEKSFIRIQSPARDKGAGFLKIGREMWNFVPRINRVIKIPPSMMMQSWMGSDFTNDDLAQESSIFRDYTHNLLGKETVDGVEYWEIELIANPDAPVVWGKIIELFRVEDVLPFRAEFYDELGDLIRTMTYSDFKVLHGRKIPTVFTLTTADKPEEMTQLIINDMEFNARIPRSVFSQQNLRRRN